MRGMGRIFKRGSVYWIAYCYRGKEYRESSRSDSESQARKLMKRRLGEMGGGRLVGPSAERLTFEDLEKIILTDYEINGKRSVDSVRLSLRHLRGAFGLDRGSTLLLTALLLMFASGRRKAPRTEVSTENSPR
jgi:hypothetical protein